MIVSYTSPISAQLRRNLWDALLKPKFTRIYWFGVTQESEWKKGASAVKLTVVHEIAKPDSKFIEAVSGGWPKILSSLKSMLETGRALEQAAAAGS
jgi:hypothetical protein